MIHEGPSAIRQLKTVTHEVDLTVVGGGLAGVCAAIAAAREGLRVVLVQDRPVLGGNASSEVRLWALGATSHMGNNNRWSREGGIINEILEENLYRNRLGHPIILDTILLEKVVEESNITLLLNTAVHEVEKKGDEKITAAIGFCSQNSTRYVLRSPYFCDASGDGVLGFLSGAAFRMGAENKEEFDEGFAPDESYGQLLGHSLYFYTKDVGEPVGFYAPSWALKDVSSIARYRKIGTNMQGCNFWWVEYGGRLDTVHDTEAIKWELWKVVYGIWDHIKNSGEYPDAANLALEWVGHIPGKRESRRFEGDYMLCQKDVVQQRVHADTVAHGGWALDLHPSDGVYSDQPGCNQWHAKGVYGIPWRCYYSRNISNLFLAGRIISASHVAFGSSRVMLTCAAGGQAVGTAAALCRESGTLPRDLLQKESMQTLQVRLDRAGQYLPGIGIMDTENLTARAQVTASSQLQLGELAADGGWCQLAGGWGMLLPLSEGHCPVFSFEISCAAAGVLQAELRRAARPGNFTPDEVIDTLELELTAGESRIELHFSQPIDRAGYYFVNLLQNPAVRVRLSEDRLTGVLALTSSFNNRVATTNLQSPPPEIGIDSFEFWLPQRRPEGHNLAIRMTPPLQNFGPENVLHGPARPTENVNAWVADPQDPQPELTLAWPEPVRFSRVIVEFDPDWDHAMECVLMTHPEAVVPFMVRDFELLDGEGRVLAAAREHHSAHFDCRLPESVETNRLSLRIRSTHGAPASVFRIRVLP